LVPEPGFQEENHRIIAIPAADSPKHFFNVLVAEFLESDDG